MSLKYSESLDSPSKYSYFLKIIILGDAATGKSSLLLRFSEDKFEKNATSTYGIDFRFKTLILNGETIKLQIWDTAGQEMYDSISSMYIKNGDGIFLLYDISARQTFTNLEKWLKVLKENSPKYDDLTIYLVGHKADLGASREVSIDEAKKFAEENRMFYIEVSSKTGANVNEAFVYLVEEILGHMEYKGRDFDITSRRTLRLEEGNKTNHCGCCTGYS